VEVTFVDAAPGLVLLLFFAAAGKILTAERRRDHGGDGNGSFRSNAVEAAHGLRMAGVACGPVQLPESQFLEGRLAGGEHGSTGDSFVSLTLKSGKGIAALQKRCRLFPDF
jgi:hypothetical protein